VEAVPDDPRIGQTLDGRYQIIAPISTGSMGAVYRAERLKLGRAVAVKFLHGSFASDPQFVGRFEREAKAMSRMAHPNCVSIIDVGMADGVPYVVMDYVTGQTLRNLIDQGPVPILRAAAITKQILAGLAHAHGLGIVHRDIKPANVMLTEATGTGDHVRLLDFGLATLLGVGTGDLSQSNVVVGTPSYMAPEQSRGDKVDGKADVYSTAVVLFELITGKKPFNAESSFELIRQHRDSPPPRLSATAPELTLPRGLDDLVHRCLSKDPAVRPTAIELARALDQMVRETGAMPAITEPAAPAPATPPRRVTTPTTGTRARRGLSALIAAVVGGGVAFAGWRVVGGDDAATSRPQRAERAATPTAPRPIDDDRPDAAPATTTDADAALATDAAPPPPPDGAPEAIEAFTLDDGGPETALPADEEVEPVAALPETAIEADRGEPTTAAELDARTTMPPVAERADTIDEARALIKAGREEEAIAALRLVRATSKKSAYAPYLLGNLYFEKRWWTVGMEHYAEAIAKNRSYRRKAVLNRNLIRALGDRRTARDASALILRSIGRIALPFLDSAAKRDPSKTVRQRAAELSRQLRRRRLPPSR
jgi:serine/threonine-protein kinase